MLKTTIMNRLENVTIVCVDTYNVGESVIALRKTLMEVVPDECLFFTNAEIEIEGVQVIKVDNINSVDDYSRFMIKQLYKYINTDFVLVIQHDGYVLNGDLFPKDLYLYDYCGALWLEKDQLNNGNGGFSWRSKKLLDAIGIDETISVLTPEDVSICRIYRRYLEQTYGLVWAADYIAERFSFELQEPRRKTFGFHGYHHKPYKPTVVIQRMGAMGDVIGVEPVLEHFYNKGYRVVLKTTPEFYHLFLQHKYPIEFYENFDANRVKHEYYNLDMSYESKPKELHLKTYYEFAGVTDGEIKRPSLYLSFDIKEHKIFKKYIVIHNDTRAQPYRNINHFSFDGIATQFRLMGYTVLQVGINGSPIQGADFIKTSNLPFLMTVVAGAELFIGIDSGISHIAQAFGVPSVIFSGSVDLRLIHPDMSKIEWVNWFIKNWKICSKPYCWHETIGCEGMECIEDKNSPPCSRFKAYYLDAELILSNFGINKND